MISCPRPALVALALCAGSLLTIGCFGDPGALEACTFTDPTGCDEPDAATTATGAAVTTSGSGGSGGSSSGSGGLTEGEGTTAAGEEASTDATATATATTDATSTSTSTTGLPVDPPPWVGELALDPAQAFELGPTLVTYETSPDAIWAQLLDDGAVIAEGPVGEPLVFPVTSAPHNNPGSTLTVVVRDEAGQTGSADIYQASNVKPPGSAVWTTQEPDDGLFSVGAGVALQGSHTVTTGVRWQGGKIVATLRRYDQAGKWKGSDSGWTKDHPSWTKLPELAAGGLSLGAVAVDAEGFIVVVGTALVDNESRMYVARFTSDGALKWEILEGVGTAGRGVGVQPDGTIYVAGSIRTGKAPDRWDLGTWVYDKDKKAYGPDQYFDPGDLELKLLNERGHAVAVLKDGRVVVVGMAEVRLPEDIKKIYLRAVAILYEGKGTRVGVWTSPGDKMKHDAALAAVATDEGFALCGYAQANILDPNDKTQILIRWLSADLVEVKAPRLELTPGTAACNALGYNRDGALVIGAEVRNDPQGYDMWIFAASDAASPLVHYLKRNGVDNGDDRVLGLSCDYMCGWVGAETVDGASQWIAGMIRG